MGVVALVCGVCEETVGTLNRQAFEAMAHSGETYVCRRCETTLDGAVVEATLLNDSDGRRWAELTRAATEG